MAKIPFHPHFPDAMSPEDQAVVAQAVAYGVFSIGLVVVVAFAVGAFMVARWALG